MVSLWVWQPTLHLPTCKMWMRRAIGSRLGFLMFVCRRLVRWDEVIWRTKALCRLWCLPAWKFDCGEHKGDRWRSPSAKWMGAVASAAINAAGNIEDLDWLITFTSRVREQLWAKRGEAEAMSFFFLSYMSFNKMSYSRINRKFRWLSLPFWSFFLFCFWKENLCARFNEIVVNTRGGKQPHALAANCRWFYKPKTQNKKKFLFLRVLLNIINK